MATVGIISEGDAAALAHGDRWRWPINATPPVVLDHIVALAPTQYAGLNHKHLTDFWLNAQALGWRGQQYARSSARLAYLLCAGDLSVRRAAKELGICNINLMRLLFFQGNMALLTISLNKSI